jgi:outer membrane protein assembly factor BamB
LVNPHTLSTTSTPHTNGVVDVIRILTTLSVLTLAAVSHAEDWPQWRGPSRDCQVKQQSWPDSLAEQNLQQAWSVPLGPSYSGPIVVGPRVFVTETRDKSHEVVRALDRQTGQEIWRVEWAGAIRVPMFANSNGSWIRSTPACDGKYLYVLGIRDQLVCLDVETGSEVWRINFSEEFGTSLPSFGAVCSPLLDGEFILIQAGASVVKLRKNDGSVQWRSKPESGGLFGQGMGASPFSSPVIATLDGLRQLIVQSRDSLSGYDISNGDKVWSIEIPAFRGMNILTPLVKGNTVFTSSYGGGTFLFDVNKVGDQFQVVERWKNKKQGYMSSPALIADNVFMHLRNQRFTCLDRETGETKWTTTPFGKYWSMVVNGNQILALDQRGELRLIDANPEEFTEVSTRTISESPTWAHLAASDGQLFVRELDAITVWNWK